LVAHACRLFKILKTIAEEELLQTSEKVCDLDLLQGVVIHVELGMDVPQG
jgi:hypothetical protein